MQLNFPINTDLSFYVGNLEIIERMPEVMPMQPFSEEAVSFFDALSKILLREGKLYTDIATFGFWCRRAAMSQEKKKYDDISGRIGKGIVFHSTPSNVPVNFAYSLAAGLMSGNANIVRLPGKEFEQVTFICEAVNKLLLSEYKNIIPYIVMLKYTSTQTLHDAFSLLCDTRVIWGGDETIMRMRKSPLKARANEISFADRYSIAVINADRYLTEENKKRVALNFYNDTFLSDQNACTSPRIIVWLGDEKEKAKGEFWSFLHSIIKEKYTFVPLQATGKLAAMYKAAANIDGIHIIKSEDELIKRLKIDNIDIDDLMLYKYNSGFFFEYDAAKIEEILPLCSEKCQTLVYYGIEQNEINSFIYTNRPHGIDRAVPIGKSMDFGFVWDGVDLIRSMSRKVTII